MKTILDIRFIIVTISLFAGFLFFNEVHGQQNNFSGDLSLNQTGAVSHSSAILDVQSSTRGVVFPRMSSASRIAIANPVRGLLVFDTTLNRYCHYTDPGWTCLGAGAGGCNTLDEAYDCGGNGNGREMDVESGSVYLDGDMDGNTTVLEVENEGSGAVATFRDQTAGGAGTEHLVVIGEDQNDALVSQVLGAGDSSIAIHGFSNSTLVQAGLFQLTAGNAMGDALEGYNRGDRHGVIGHTDTKVPVSGGFSIASLPVSGVMGISSNTELRKGTSGVSIASDGVWGKTWVSSSKYKTVMDPRNIIAGVHGTIESAQSTIETKDFVGVLGIPRFNGVGVLGIGGPQNTVKGHGVVGISGWSTNTPSTNAGVWGVTREAQTWAGMNATFPLEEESHNKVQVAVLGQSSDYVAVWGESLNRIGVVGNTNGRMALGNLPAFDAGVFGCSNGAGYGTVGKSLSASLSDAGVRATGQYDKDKAAALEIHDGAIRVTKDSAMDTPADVIDVTVTGWNMVFTCPAGDPLHDHLQAFVSDPVPISNQYVDATRSVILVSVMAPIPGVSIQLAGQVDGMFAVEFTIHTANGFCSNNPPSSGFKVHYMIVNK